MRTFRDLDPGNINDVRHPFRGDNRFGFGTASRWCWEREVYNGDIGFITAVDAETGEMTVRFDEQRMAAASRLLSTAT